MRAWSQGGKKKKKNRLKALSEKHEHMEELRRWKTRHAAANICEVTQRLQLKAETTGWPGREYFITAAQKETTKFVLRSAFTRLRKIRIHFHFKSEGVINGDRRSWRDSCDATSSSMPSRRVTAVRGMWTSRCVTETARRQETRVWGHAARVRGHGRVTQEAVAHRWRTAVWWMSTQTAGRPAVWRPPPPFSPPPPPTGTKGIVHVNPSEFPVAWGEEGGHTHGALWKENKTTVCSPVWT